MIRPPPRSTLFPYTPLSRSEQHSWQWHRDSPTQLAPHLPQSPRTSSTSATIPTPPVETGEPDLRRARIARLVTGAGLDRALERDRKSTRLNSSHLVISYAVF